MSVHLSLPCLLNIFHPFTALSMCVCVFFYCLVCPPPQCPHYSVCLYACTVQFAVTTARSLSPHPPPPPRVALLVCLPQDSLPFIRFPRRKQIAAQASTCVT